MRDCWNQIGVWSKQSNKCDKLQEVIHCRNCEVYSKAGRKVMEQSVSAEYLAQWTRNYARVVADKAQKPCSVIVFRLGAEWFALPTKYCQSVENRSTIHSIPRYTNDCLLGVVNIRGTLQLCFSLEALLRVTPAEDKSLGQLAVYKRLLVLVQQQRVFVCPVDEVGGIERIDEDSLEHAPDTLSPTQAEYVAGVVKAATHRITLLRIEQVLNALEDVIGG